MIVNQSSHILLLLGWVGHKKITNYDEVSNLCCLTDLFQEYISACDHHSYSTTAKEKTKLTDLLS